MSSTFTQLEFMAFKSRAVMSGSHAHPVAAHLFSRQTKTIWLHVFSGVVKPVSMTIHPTYRAHDLALYQLEQNPTARPVGVP